jgi:beta-N-acetylhexosaminidase
MRDVETPFLYRKNGSAFVMRALLPFVACSFCLSWTAFAQHAAPAPLSLEAKIGQMVQVRVYADDAHLQGAFFQSQLQTVSAIHAGSVDVRVHLDGPNLLRAPKEIAAHSLHGLQAAQTVPLLAGADIERGLIARVANAPEMPMAMAVGASGDAKEAYRVGAITAREARDVSIQWAFAPVVDLNDDPENPVIGDRSFGEDPEQVSRLVTAYIEGAHAGGMLVTAKHFPGHGDTGMDSHVGVVTLKQPLDHLNKYEFAPFRAAIAAGVDAIMLAHARVPALDPDPNHIATTSPKVIAYLRNELGFKGVIITDAMEMRGLTDLYRNDPHPVARAAVDAVKAGVDIVMLPDHVDEAYQAILAAVKSGQIPESRIDESVARIMAMKRKAGLFENRFVDENKVKEIFSHKEDFEFAQQAADSGVVLVTDRGFTLPVLPAVSVNTTSTNEKPEKLVAVLFTDSERSPLGHAMEEELKVRRPDAQVVHVYYDNRSEPLRSDVLDAVNNGDQVIVGAFMTNLPGKKYVAGGKIANVFGLNGQSAQLFSQILGLGGKKVMVISLGSPYLILHYPIIQNYVCTFSTSSTSERAAVKALFGEIHNHARLPITLPGVAVRGFAMEWPTVASTIQEKRTLHTQ